MTPCCKITDGAGVDLSRVYLERLGTLTITDQATENSDSLVITLSDRDGKLKLPEEGETLSVALGYGSKLRNMGQFVVDSVRVKGPPDIVSLSGKAAPFTAAQGFKPFQTRKTRSWHLVKLGDLIRTVAAEAGMMAAVSPEYNGWLLKHLDQTNESDMNLLTRLARDWKAVMKPTCGYLVFVKRGEAKSVTGMSLEGITLTRAECSSWEYSRELRTKFGKARTRYHDAQTGKTMRVTATGETVITEEVNPDQIDDDGEESVYEHPLDHADEMGAQNAAMSMLDQMDRGAETIRVDFAGRPDIVAEGNVTLGKGFRSEMLGDWCIKTVTHTYTKSGFTTEVQAETPGGEAGKKKKASKKKASGASSTGANPVGDQVITEPA